MAGPAVGNGKLLNQGCTRIRGVLNIREYTLAKPSNCLTKQDHLICIPRMVCERVSTPLASAV